MYSYALLFIITHTAYKQDIFQSLEAIFWDSGSASGLWAFTEDIVQGWARAILATKMSEWGYLIPRYVYSGLLRFYLCLLYLLIPLPVIDFQLFSLSLWALSICEEHCNVDLNKNLQC